MKLLIFSQYFSPENFIINDIARTLVAQGHEVVVATGKPNYPDGRIFAGYRAWGCQYERYLDSIDVLRVPLWPRGEGGAKNMVLNYLSFVFAGLVFFPWMLRKREFDAILVFAPSPITQAIPAIPIKWLKRAQLALWIQDLWPESLAATGFVKSPYLLKMVGWMVRGIYAGCDRLLVQSHAFVDSVARYAPRKKITYYPNSVDAQTFNAEVEVDEQLSQVLKAHFCVVFAGNLGTAQALETLVEAAKQLRDEPDVRLVLVGSGSRLEWLREQKQVHSLDNLILPGRFPAVAMPAVFAQSSALLVSLNNESIFAQTIPSKVQSYLASGKPIIASLNGEGARVVQEARAGLTSPAEEVAPLVANIRKMYSLGGAQREEMGRCGRSYFAAHFEMDQQVRSLVELLKT
ncbi:glycosyltransferase family 4 protein [Pseudomonas protegens]|uniref:glycosyltransferase family 4 protein n=1 Tax=Pseudomonas protegens TaxID=380021 RepID=UPI001C8E73A3|nr:glycosyltransferase family 4 protein [Pseudomonas protegens]QZI73620.1 glycosyltransferase family 4 protein [Pseudomonas protegens]